MILGAISIIHFVTFSRRCICLNFNKKIGWRTIKTATSVGIVITLFEWLNRGSGLLACLSAVYSLQTNTSQSVTFGKNRIIGNILGVFCAIFILLIQTSGWLPEAIVLNLGTAVGIILLINLCNLFNLSHLVFPASAAYLVVILGDHGNDVIGYGLNRVLDTIIGSLISLAVNYVLPNPHLQDNY